MSIGKTFGNSVNKMRLFAVTLPCRFTVNLMTGHKLVSFNFEFPDRSETKSLFAKDQNPSSAEEVIAEQTGTFQKEQQCRHTENIHISFYLFTRQHR